MGSRRIEYVHARCMVVNGVAVMECDVNTKEPASILSGPAADPGEEGWCSELDKTYDFAGDTVQGFFGTDPIASFSGRLGG